MSSRVTAPMPCKVTRVDVQSGTRVTKQQTLMVVESMKTETVIRSPRDGVIAKVLQRQGDSCAEGGALVEFED